MSQPRPPRPDRPEAGPFVHSRLDEEVERLTTEPAWHDGDRNSITLTRRSGLTLVLTVLRAGAVFRQHRAPTAVTFHVISKPARTPIFSLRWPRPAPDSMLSVLRRRTRMRDFIYALSADFLIVSASTPL